MKRILFALTVLLIAVSMIFAGSVSLIKHTAPTPLEQLENRTRQIPMLHTLYLTPMDDAFARQALVLETVVVNVLGVQVNYIDMEDPSMAGWTMLSPSIRAVNVDKNLHGTARLEVLAHEAGHRLQPPVLAPQSSESEVFAEAVSFLVCRAYGHDDLEISATYLAIHKGGLHVLRDYRMEIEFAAIVLSGGMKSR